MTKSNETPAGKKFHGVWKGFFVSKNVEAPAADSSTNDLDALLTTPSPLQKEALLSQEEQQPDHDLPTLKQEEKKPRKETASLELLAAMENTPSTKEATVVVVEEALRTETKETGQKKTEEKKQAPTPIVDPEKPAEIVYKPMVRSQKSGFKDFLGSIQTIGMGHEKTALIQNLATMLDAGLPLVDSLKTLQADTRSRAGRKLQQSILDAVENGSPLWRAFEDQHCFSPDVIALVRIGEEAGNLAENMSYLAIQQEKDQALRSKVTMAMIYPTIVLTIMLIIVMGLGMFVLPNLIGVLYSLGVPLPLVTRMVIAFTDFFTMHGTTAIPGGIGGLLLLIILAKFTPLRGAAQWVMFKIPGIGRLAREATIARFGVILGGLLQAGVPLVDAIRSLAEVTSIVAYRKFYVSLLEHVAVGDSFAKSFIAIRGSAGLLPVSVQQLVTTGERSGSLAKILLKIADIYEKKANDTAQKLPVILEPMLLLFIGALVGTIAFAIIVPIYSIVGNVGN